MGHLEFEENILVQDFIRNKDLNITKILYILENITDTFAVSNYKEFINAVSTNSTTIRILKRIFEYNDFSAEICNTKLSAYIVPIKFFADKLSFEEALNLSTSDLEKLLVSLFFVTKQMNANGYEFLYNFDYFLFFNTYLFFPISISSKDKKLLFSVFKELGEEYFLNYKILKYNIFKKYKKGCPKIRKAFENKILKENLFNFDGLNDLQIETQEEFLLNSMFKISLNDEGKIIPLSTLDGIIYPDFSTWNPTMFIQISKHFNSTSIQYYLDAVEYIVSDDKQNNMLNEDCVKFFINRISSIKKEDDWFKNRYLINFLLMCPFTKNTKQYFKNNSFFLRKMNTPIFVKKKFSVSKLPIPKSVNQAIKLHSLREMRNLYANIDDIGSFVSLLKHEELLDSLSIAKFLKIKKAFYKLCLCTHGVGEACLYIYFSELLCSVGTKKLNIDCEKEKKMLVKSWKINGYKNSIDGMAEIKGETTYFSHDQIEGYSKSVADDCRNFGYSNNFNSKGKLVNLMSETSKHAFMELCASIQIKKDFPVETKISTKAPLGEIISEHLQKSITGREYILMNHLEPESFFGAYYNSANLSLQINVNLFNKENELLNRIMKENKNLNLVNFNEVPCYADLCQLFPAIDNKILELGEKFNICPLKNEKCPALNERKEASTVLKTTIKKLVDEFDSLEVAADLICVYLMLFDKNSLNIRNTSVHGNDYPNNENQLSFNRKAALISLGIILDRIKTV